MMPSEEERRRLARQLDEPWDDPVRTGARAARFAEERRERAMNAAFEAKGRELSYTEEAWLNAALDEMERP